VRSSKRNDLCCQNHSQDIAQYTPEDMEVEEMILYPPGEMLMDPDPYYPDDGYNHTDYPYDEDHGGIIY
jgi:hypothetical protein